ALSLGAFPLAVARLGALTAFDFFPTTARAISGASASRAATAAPMNVTAPWVGSLQSNTSTCTCTSGTGAPLLEPAAAVPDEDATVEAAELLADEEPDAAAAPEEAPTPADEDACAPAPDEPCAPPDEELVDDPPSRQPTSA